MPLFPWAFLITGGMLLLTLPILSGAFLMVLADLHSNTLNFQSSVSIFKFVNPGSLMSVHGNLSPSDSKKGMSHNAFLVLFTGYPQDFLESIIQAVFILFFL